MKAFIFLLTILGMIAINVVTGGPIEDPQHGASSENVIKNVFPGCCWKVEVSYSETHHVQKEQKEIFQDYVQEPGLVNGHVHYTSSDGRWAIWFDKTGKCWNIGHTLERGYSWTGHVKTAHSGFCGKACTPNCPNEVAYTWRYWNSDPWLWLDADKGLRIRCTL